MFTLDLQWKEFNISLPIIQSSVKEMVDTPLLGVSANSVCQLHFEEELTESELELIQEYWEALDEDSEEATSYKTADQIQEEMQADKEAKISSAKVKLANLGLTEEEISVILGV